MTGADVLTLESVVRFLAYFCVEINPFNDPDAFMSALRQLDPRYKDGRNLVRYQLEQDVTQWPREAVDIVMACALDMRMYDPSNPELQTPICGDFKHGLVIVLGGARKSNRDRACYAAAQLSETGNAYVLIAGSSRKLDKTEQESVVSFAPGAETEYDLCVAAADEVESGTGFQLEVFLVDNERAGTPDVLATLLGDDDWARILGHRPHVVTAVTTQIYQLSTELDLRRVASNFGFAPGQTAAAGCQSDSEVVAKRTTAIYLSEVLRTLRAAALAAQAGV